MTEMGVDMAAGVDSLACLLLIIASGIDRMEEDLKELAKMREEAAAAKKKSPWTFAYPMVVTPY